MNSMKRGAVRCEQCIACGCFFDPPEYDHRCPGCIEPRVTDAISAAHSELAERAWEDLNVVDMPDLEAPSGIANARWGFRAGYLAALGIARP